ncbi:px domain protein [Fusarium beomiforme]|uniref:Px domain protein n=1 Tax=Fusarium beomiforme TaxID=44412 RepID=A0A9P5AFM6_9HYPO|nr:px domain protein [Fusarium beomiforme]
MTSTTLAPEQVHALFDILTHHETYAEIQGFKYPDAVKDYGYPFSRTTVEPQTTQSAPPSTGWRSWAGTPVSSRPGTPKQGAAKEVKETRSEDDEKKPSSAPILQAMLSRFILKLPGVKDLPREFWSVRVQGLLTRLGEAELSESYDKGALGTRKVLATGSSGLLEMVGRGVLGGVKKTSQQEKSPDKKVEYDRTKAADLVKAWDDVVNGLVYGTLADEMFGHFSKTADLEGHSPVIGAAAEYAIIHLATFIHHIFVLSPEGQYLLKLLENAHNLIPYKMVKQTLRMGNAASMISAMMRLLLAKLSVTSVTNWIGLTANADDGMNLLQRIISLVLSWDAGEFRKSADKVEKAKDRPSDEMLEAIRQYIAMSRDEHKTVRDASKEHAQSIITAIFNGANPTLATQLDDQKHALCLEYYSALLSVRDRESITTALCRQPPDLFTATIKDLFTAYEPMIRMVHSQIDLREHVEAGQLFIDEFIKAGKPKKDGSMPTVDDYVDLFMRNRELMYRWVHAFAASCPDVWEEMRTWTNDAVLKFRQERKPVQNANNDSGEKTSNGAVEMSTMDEQLNKLFQSVSEMSQKEVLDALDNHAVYLAQVEALSLCRLQRIIDSDDSEAGNMSGPGMYLSRWQSLLEDTLITPETPKGPVRHGRDVKNTLTMGKIGVEGTEKAREDALQAAVEEAEEGPEAPDVHVVIRELSEGFKKLLQESTGKEVK